MLGFLLRRLGTSAVVLFLVLTVLFFVLELAPGRPAELYASPTLDAAQRAKIVTALGLDQPLLRQYGRWLNAVALHGDWGTSFAHQRPVARVLAAALPHTLLLAFAALLVDFALAVPLAIAAARRRESRLDHGIRGVSLILFSLPTFWLALMAILLFSYLLPIFPAGHSSSAGAAELGRGARLLDLGWHLALPALVLGLSSTGGTLRVLRANLLEILSQDYIRMARAKGLSERRVLWVHALRNASGPLVQLAGLSLPALLNGTLVVEFIFAWPGVGRVTFEAISSADYPLVLAGTAWSGAMVALGSLAADLAHAALDPRVRDAAR